MRRNPRSARAALLAVAATAILTVTGCSAAHTSGGSAATSATTVMTPAGTKSVDKITWNVFEGEPQTIDPFHSADYTPNMINSNLCENLLAQTSDYSIKPNLASSFTNPDPLTWVYELRSDVTFWDGTPMTADDVVYSLQKNLTDTTSFYNYLFSSVASVSKTGDHEVTVKLSKPDYLFNNELSDFAGVVVEKKFAEAAGDKFGTPGTGVMCTGPYKFDSWAQGQSITVSAYDHYWNTKLQPKVKQIVFTFLTDASAITSGLLSGQIDGTYSVPTSGLTQLRSTSAGKLYEGEAPLETELVVANPKGALANENVRKALQMAIDWKGVGAQVYGGLGTPTGLQMASASFGFAKTGLSSLKSSVTTDGTAKIDEAKKLLASVPADVKSTQISLVVPQQNETQQLGVAVKSAADKIGLNFKLNVVPATGYSNYLYDPATRGSTDLLYTEFWPNIPDPLDWLGITAVTGGSFNQSGYSGIDAIYNQARQESDQTARAKLVVQAEKQLRDEMNPMIPGVEIRNTVWMNSRISGAPATFDYVYYPWAAYLGGTK